VTKRAREGSFFLHEPQHGSFFPPYLSAMEVLFDPLGKPLDLSRPPRRIVSLVPSQTELLWDLGLDAEVAGITKFCIHPDQWFRTKPRVGGTKQVHAERVEALAPDLILANKEENVREQVEHLAQRFPTWVSDISNLGEALNMIRCVGRLAHREKQADSIALSTEEGFASLQQLPGNGPTVAYLLWREPYMSVGQDTFIHDLLQRLGLRNVMGNRMRYPEVTVEQLQGCDFLLLSSEPYPFRQKHIDELQAQLPDSRILLVDGELFSWYGSRLLHTPAYFRKLRQEMGLIP